MQFTYAKGATPLSPDEIHNLIPKHLTNQSQLDEWEQYNIARAENWILSRKRTNILTIQFLQKLHQKMFCDTWVWAGCFRKRQTNIGVNALYIPQELKILLDDVIFWRNNSTFSTREIAARIHHRLVLIHPFPNGNGRFARLFADLFLLGQKEPRFSWGSRNLVHNSPFRERYISALQDADKGDHKALMEFVDS